MSFDGESSGTIGFRSSLMDEELQELRWYVESYAAQYMTEIDDDRAWRIVSNFKKMGIALYKSVASASKCAERNLIEDFLKLDEPGRLVTIQSGRPEILALPWELLHQPDGAFLFNDNPRVSIRRNLAKLQSEQFVNKNQPKETLRLLMLVSRPEDAGFMDPRADSQAVSSRLQALMEQLQSKRTHQEALVFPSPDGVDVPINSGISRGGHGRRSSGQ